MKCLNGASLDAYFEALQSGRPTSEIDAHLVGCRRCAFLVKQASKPTPAGLAKRAEEVGRLLRTKRPEAIEPGQLWRLREQINSGRYPVGIVTRGPEMSIDPENPDIRMAMANLDATENDRNDDDIVVEAAESPLGLRYLVEHWNERPVPVDELETFLGRLAPAAWKRLAAALNDLGDERVDLTEAVRAYRTRRIRETAALSQASLERAARAASEDEEPGFDWPLYIPLPAGELLPAVAADKSLSHFRIWGKKLLRELRSLSVKCGLSGRETSRGFRFRFHHAMKRMIINILGPKNALLESFSFSDGIFLLTEEMITDWKRVTGVSFQLASRDER
ncbi:MAG TPA: hypothetical protein VIV61_02955 [Candidatus Ozemobacteraceae bacterium]